MDDRKSLLKEKAGLLKELLDGTKGQADLISRGDVEGLCRVTDERQARIDAIDRLDDRLKVAATPAESDGEPEERLLREEILRLVSEIEEIDGENLRNAKTLSDSLAAGIKEATAGKCLLAYRPAALGDSLYVNRKG